jgi:hypothetical protein
MALTEEQFLLAIRAGFADYCRTNGRDLRVGTRDKNLTMRELRITLLACMMEIIEYYFRTTTGGDENCFTEEEIEDVISHANRIMGTEYYTDLS